ERRGQFSGFSSPCPWTTTGCAAAMTGTQQPPPSAGAHPVVTLSFRQRIACAAATLFGNYGAVTRLAHQHGLCRQTVYRQTDAVRADLEAPAQRQELLDLRQQLEQARVRCADLQRRLDDAVVLDPDRQAEFARSEERTSE